MGTNRRYAPPDFAYAIEQWDAGDRRVDDIIALANNIMVAQAAFRAAIRERPRAIVTLRQGARVLERHTPHPPDDPAALVAWGEAHGAERRRLNRKTTKSPGLPDVDAALTGAGAVSPTAAAECPARSQPELPRWPRAALIRKIGS